MREIKFRGYCLHDKRMYPILAMSFDGNSLYTVQRKPTIKKSDHTLYVMQYTGLKDKNGVDIYEGDIVIMYPDDFEISQAKEVKWCADRPVLGFDGSGPILCEGNSSILLVIGNIHENPESLGA